VTDVNSQELILRAAIEFGSLYTYEIRYGTLGRTLYIDAANKGEANLIRRKISGYWNGLYVIVRYTQTAKIALQQTARVPSDKEKQKALSKKK
jgi:hypothetical protein